MAEVLERLDKHDRQIAAMRDLLREGVRYMIETRKDLRALAASQKRTEAILQSYLIGIQRGNGHTKGKVDDR